MASEVDHAGHAQESIVAHGGEAADLIVDGLTKSFEGAMTRRLRRKRSASEGTGRVLAVDNIDLAVEPGELFTLLGPSGCGKTTTLRSIAGLERPDSGRIVVAGTPLYDSERRIDVPANQRSLGMVFQSYAIWPHMSVFDNVAFPFQVMRRGKQPGKKVVAERVDRVLDLVGLGDLAGRSATTLSGGQQQRLALSRALVIEPHLMLLDEPLSNLDAKLRENMRFELKRLQREIGLTAVYVTHDQSEALALSSRVAVMEQGHIRQIGKPRDVYENPCCRFVADFVGVTNFVRGKVTAAGGSWCEVTTEAGTLRIMPTSTVAVGEDVLLSLRPEYITLQTQPPVAEALNQLQGQVLNRAFLGEAVDHVVRVGDVEMRNRSNPAQSIPPGTDIYVTIDPLKISTVPS